MKAQNEKLTIGLLAKSAGVGVETIRFYERQGLLKKPNKPIHGYRQYSADDSMRIRFIKRAQELGFSLREIQELLEINTKPNVGCSDIKSKAKNKIAEVEVKIQDLIRMKSSLMKLIEACKESKKAATQCKVIDCFNLDCECE